jgi:D-sedoheptulose 7-phosphate isomerase
LDRIENYINAVTELLNRVSREHIHGVADLVLDAYRAGKQVFIMGNGGSAATASHLACDLQKGVGCYRDQKFKVMAVTDSIPLMTAWANDFDYSDVFAEQLSTWVQPGDLVIAFSGSGSSPNVVKGVELANKKGVVTVGISGFKGGRLASVAQHNIIVPSDDMQHIEDVHLILAHLIFRYVLEEIAA